EERAKRSSGAHSSQLNCAHLFSAESIGGAVVRATSLAGLMTAPDRVMQPTAPRRANSAVAIATRFATFWNGSLSFILNLPFAGARHRAVRSLHLLLHRRSGAGFDSR